MYGHSGTKTTWIPEKDLYTYTNSITSAVYAFGLFDKQPNEKHWPYFREEIFYIGMSGGLKESRYVAKKTETRYRVETFVHNRMKAHKSNADGKLKHPWVMEQVEFGKQIYVCFILPPKDLSEDKVRNWLSMVESEQILLYQMIYDQKPLLNLAESFDRSNAIPESFSQQTMRKIKEVSLEKFLEND